MVLPLEAAVLAAVLTGHELPAVLRVVIGVVVVAAVGFEVREFRRCYRGRRDRGTGRRAAARAAVGDVLPSPVLAAVRLECRIWRGFVRGVLRRPDVPEPAVPFTHHRTLAPVRWIVVAVLVLEVGVVHLLVPSGTIRLILLALGVYSVVWVLGYLLGSGPVRPHLVSNSAVVVRNGLTTEVTVPADVIKSVRVHRQSRAGMVSIQCEDDVLHVVDNGGTSLHLALSAPLQVTLTRGRAARVTDIRIWVDEPGEMADCVQRMARSRTTK